MFDCWLGQSEGSAPRHLHYSILLTGWLAHTAIETGFLSAAEAHCVQEQGRERIGRRVTGGEILREREREVVCKSEIERGKEESERSREEKVVSTKLSQRTEAKNVLNCCFFFSFSFLLFFFFVCL